MVVKKRARNKSGVAVFLVALLITAGVLCAQWAPFYRLTAAQPGSSEPADADPLSLYSSNAILMRLDDQKVLIEKSADRRIYPASLTKIMTVLVAMERIADPEKLVAIEQEWYDELIAADASMAGFLPGERVSVNDLFYGALLCSGAECCIALAVEAAGSQTAFVSAMNEKARQLGMHHTHFSNVTGLHQDDHYSAVQDLAVLLRNALQNETFRTIFTTKRHAIAPTSRHPQGMTVASSLFAKLSSPSFEDGQILGGKTGYTQQAGLCLATLAVKKGREWILVTAGAPGDHTTEAFHIIDAFHVYSMYAAS